MQFSRVRGTEDILDVKLYNFIIAQASKHLARYGFTEIQLPILEPTALFVHSLGEQTDVVTKEMYVFEPGGESICLRPEATAGTMRAFLENHIEERPWKVWTHGPMFRHERPQKGRWRQFTQLNIEVIDSASITQDAYFIKMLDVFFKKSLSLENYVIKLNFLGCREDRKRHRVELASYLATVQDKMCKTCLVRQERNILRVFDCKEAQCQEAYRHAPQITDCLCSSCQTEWEQLKNLLEILSVSFIHVPQLVRGLDYYQKTVFEFMSRDLGSQDSFVGGGRYELGQELGSKTDVPSIGCAIGVGRLSMILASVQEKLILPQQPALYVVIPMSVEQQALALLVADTMQAQDICVEVLLEGGSMKSMMRKANKMGAAFVLVIGEDEQRNGTVTVKNMANSESSVIKQTEVVAFIKKG